MKNKLLFGAIAIGVMSFGIGVQDASALTLGTCGTSVNLDLITGESMTKSPNCQILMPSSLNENTKLLPYDGEDPNYGGGAPVVNVNDVDGSGLSFFDENWTYFDKLDLLPVEEEEKEGDGSFDYSAALSSYQTVMAVFKDGKNGSTFGILLDNNSPLTWDGALWNPQGTVSNVTFFGADPVPTPAAVLPILGGLFGAAFRRQKKEQLS